MRKDQFIKFWIGRASGGTAYEAETIALLARAAVQPSTALAVLINTTIKGLKDDGVFALGDCLYVRGVHEAQLACQNWIKNAHNSTLVNSPVFTAKEGFKCNGSTNYINNNFKPLSEGVNLKGGLGTTSASFLMMNKLMGTVNSKYAFGATKTSTQQHFEMIFYTAANEAFYMASLANQNKINITANDYAAYSKGTDGNEQAYLNGSPVGVPVLGTSWPNLPDYNMYEGCCNYDNVASTFYNGQWSLSWYGGNLNATQQLAIYTRLKYFYDNVGGTF